MPTEGKWLIVVILCLAFAAAAFGWYWNLQTSRHALEFWGAEAAQRITGAPQAELLKLTSGITPSGAATPADDLLDVDGRSFAIVDRADIGHSRGFGNVRHMLVQDASFDWSAPVNAGPVKWTLALRFRDDRGATVVLLALPAEQTALLGRAGAALLHPAAAKILTEFAGEQFRH